jgi:DNA-binding response OmpR family regulator
MARARQHRIMFRLAQAEGEPVGYEELARATWPFDERPRRWLDCLRFCIGMLRIKGYRITNLRGRGYRLWPSETRAVRGLRIHGVM